MSGPVWIGRRFVLVSRLSEEWVGEQTFNLNCYFIYLTNNDWTYLASSAYFEMISLVM